MIDGDVYGAGSPPCAVAAFNAAVNETLMTAMRVSDQRGQEYGDSWAIENQHTPFQDAVHETIQEDRFVAWAGYTAEERRLVTIAALCDVKLSRLIGGWKDDTLDDLINYTAALRTWMRAYLDHEQSTTGQAA